MQGAQILQQIICFYICHLISWFFYAVNLAVLFSWFIDPIPNIKQITHQISILNRKHNPIFMK